MPQFSLNDDNSCNEMTNLQLDFAQNKIEKISEFTLSIKEFKRVEFLELNLNNNLLSKLPVFSINNKNNNKN